MSALQHSYSTETPTDASVHRHRNRGRRLAASADLTKSVFEGIYRPACAIYRTRRGRISAGSLSLGTGTSCACQSHRRLLEVITEQGEIRSFRLRQCSPARLSAQPVCGRWTRRHPLCKIHGTKHRPRLTALLARGPTKLAAIALADKIARMA
jgi:hypothetical protein